MTLEPRQLWPVFLGSVFLLMGVSLAADARFHAASALDWQKETRQPATANAAGLLWLYRAFGAGFAGVGVWLLAGWLFFRAALLDKLGSPALGPAAGGALLICGGGAFIFKREAPRVPAFVEAELPAAELALGRRVSTWCRRALIALVTLYGVLLILRSPQ